MTDRCSYYLINTGISLASNANRLNTNDEGDVEAVCELEIPNNLIPNSSGFNNVETVELEATKLQLSLKNIPIAQIPIDTRKTNNRNYISTCELDVWPFSITESKQLKPSSLSDSAFPFYQHSGTYTMNLMIPTTKAGCEYKNGSLYIRDISTIEEMLQNAIENAMTLASTDDSTTPPTVHLNSALKPKVSFSSDNFSISYDTAQFNGSGGGVIPVLWNQSYIEHYAIPPQLKQNLDSTEPPPPKRPYRYNVQLSSTNVPSFTLLEGLESEVFNIVGNDVLYKTFSFLPWIKINVEEIEGLTSNLYPHITLEENKYFYILNCETAKLNISSPETVYTANGNLVGNLCLSYVWENLPLTTMSPLSSIVLTIDGIDIISQRQPINPIDCGAGTITQQFPILENYYVMAQSFSQLHDELYVVKDAFDINIKFRTKVTAGQQRYIRLSAKYLTKDGFLHNLFIPKNGNFSVQLGYRIIYNWTPQ